MKKTMDNDLKKYKIEEYLEQEIVAEEKSEYDNGLILNLSGGTLNHGIIGNNINSEINTVLKTKNSDCISINNDVKIYIDRANSFVYPDGMLVCGKIEINDKDKHSISNPKLIIEVLSKSTESYDRGAKFRKYSSLVSFCEYVLIDQYQPIVDVLFRSEKNYWKMVTTIGLDKSIYLNTIDANISLQDIYRNTLDLQAPQFMLDL